MNSLLSVVALAALAFDDGLYDRIRLMEDRRAAIETSFVCTVHRSVPMQADLSWDEIGLLERHEVDWLAFRGRWKQVSAVTQADGEYGRLTASWNGASWYQRNEDGDAYIDNEPQCGFVEDCFALFNLSDGPTFAGGLSISDLLSNFPVSTIVEDDELAVSLSLDPEGTTTVALRFLTRPELLLSEATVEIRSPGDLKLKVRIHYRVEEWGECDGLILPNRAFRDGYLFARDLLEARGEFTPTVGRSVYIRKECRSGASDPPDGDAFDAPFEVGDYVTDRRADVSYRIGGAQIKVGGHRFYTTEQILLDTNVVRKLPDLIDESKSTDRSGRSTLVSAACVGLFVGLVLVFARRRLRGGV